ncbi:uncharacterized protein LOC127253902 isoform X2 [Andrographis paniculata]|nr:uncharacterized protein LOC127253902 isoform X2 [Andrographis paniculata]
MPEPYIPSQLVDLDDLIPCEMQVIDVPVTTPDSSIDLSKTNPLVNLGGNLSMPTAEKNAPNQIGEGRDKVKIPICPQDNSSESNGVLWGSNEELMNVLSLPVSSYSLLYEYNLFQDFEVSKSTPKNSVRKELQSFPTNVKVLLQTGIFNEILVRYVSSSVELPGVISEQGYICGCNSCNFSKILNAYEFERHAGCKTSHPNDRIRLENGKSMHQIVQELKSIPREMLFDAIQIVAGCPINQEAFRAWKDSFHGLLS